MITVRTLNTIYGLEPNKIYNTTESISVGELVANKFIEHVAYNAEAPLISFELQSLEYERKKIQTLRNKDVIKLPQKEMDLAFVNRLAMAIKDKDIDLFYEPSSSKLVEITEWHDKQKDRYIFGKRFVEPLRLKSILEDRFSFEIELVTQTGDFVHVKKSPPKALIEYAMVSDSFRDALRHINGVFESPYLYIKADKLYVTKNGYNEDCRAYVRKDAPVVSDISLDEAKAILNECLLDFPWQSEQDKVYAIAAIITPMLRGIYGHYGVRTPVFAYLANQQGCGKDYLAGIRHFIYTGKFEEDAPLSNDKGSNSEEMQKEFVAAAITGQQFMHNSNCRGRLENAAYEKQATASSIRGRGLGTNVMINSENVLELSFSGNYGLSFNKDIARRSLFVNLFVEVEDTTKRKFTKNIHAWIKDNRAKVLSAIYTLIKTWWEAGHKMGEGVNASYPTWALYCSGVMEYHNLGDCCATASLVINDVGGDTETKDISYFNREIGSWLSAPENSIDNYVQEHSKEGLVKKDIFALFQNVFRDNDDRPFAKFNLDEPRDRRELGRTLNKYIGTFRGGYRMVIYKEDQKQDRIRYKFVPSVPTVPITTPHTQGPQETIVRVKVDPVGTVRTNCIIENPTQLQIDMGEVFETQPGVYRKVI